ncbi:ABC transporter ATP-binding protein [Clavibacter michiganensis subsp. phaseoli]|uniref:ABC transporter ATP-binding protein n=1 Tax=Clavibacter phaseoli TaxID=1734031 RepID=A0A8I0S9F9_9MICO|nr:ABC transporter ATP-binding protein [Clavibacter phaseoli]MBF4631508.1 ABC transporter ATP-binding protein [Clavibacter phaseoli]
MYTLQDVRKTYRQGTTDVTALEGVTLEIPDGQLVAIQGPTGGGKSTLLQMLGALDRPTSGTVTLGGDDLSTAGDRRLAEVRATQIGFVFQGFNLIPTLSARENVETALEPLGVATPERRARATAALELVGLGDRAGHLPSQLSGGQQQRVAIARALVKEPTVLLADEPTGNLDEETRDEIMDLLEGLWRDRGLTLVLVTHDSAVARRAERRLHIARGRVTEVQAATLLSR